MSHTARAHAKISPSGLERVFACPGSVRLSAEIPDRSSPYAAEGTAAHELAQHCLESGHDADRYAGWTIDITAETVMQKFRQGLEPDGNTKWEVTDEMAEGVQLYLDHIRALVEARPEMDVAVEAKLDLSRLVDGMFGTADFCAYEPLTQTLYIRDFKYGRGYTVEVKENPQLLAYAAGAARKWHNRGVDVIDLGIVQPRTSHPDGRVRTHAYDAIELAEYEIELKAAVAAAGEPDAPLKPGDHCQFCKAAPVCPALQAKVLAETQAIFTDQGVELPPVNFYSAEELSEKLKIVDQVESWCKRLREFAHAEALNGRIPPGFKLVGTRATRKWTDEPRVRSAMLRLGFEDEDLYEPPKLKSPAQMEKLLAKPQRSVLDDYVEKKSSGTVLAALDDPRPKVAITAGEMFSD